MSLHPYSFGSVSLHGTRRVPVCRRGCTVSVLTLGSRLKSWTREPVRTFSRDYTVRPTPTIRTPVLTYSSAKVRDEVRTTDLVSSRSHKQFIYFLRPFPRTYHHSKTSHSSSKGSFLPFSEASVPRRTWVPLTRLRVPQVTLYLWRRSTRVERGREGPGLGRGRRHGEKGRPNGERRGTPRPCRSRDGSRVSPPRGLR